MIPADQARESVRDILNSAAESWDLPDLGSLSTQNADALVRSILLAQGHSKVPAALSEYWRLAGSPTGGIWREFATAGGFDPREGLSARMLAMDTALASGADWQMFRYGEPLIVFQYLPGGEVLWVPCDSDEREIDHDPAVWILTEHPGVGPVVLSESFTEYLENAVSLASEARIPKL